jgi:uncharacterized protein (DUF4415 family)
MSRKNIVRHTLDPAHLAPLTAKQTDDLKALAALPDEQIDTSDIPPLTEAFWENAVRNPFYRPVKQQITVRMDADVLMWLRSTGRGYQTKLNGILRQAMLQELGNATGPSSISNNVVSRRPTSRPNTPRPPGLPSR